MQASTTHRIIIMELVSQGARVSVRSFETSGRGEASRGEVVGRDG